MKLPGLMILCLASCTLFSCDAANTYGVNQSMATLKMQHKIKTTEEALREYTDTLLHREAQRLSDSIKRKSLQQ